MMLVALDDHRRATEGADTAGCVVGQAISELLTEGLALEPAATQRLPTRRD